MPWILFWQLIILICLIAVWTAVLINVAKAPAGKSEV